MTDIFVLDFDGVLCDSAEEASYAAWRAGRRLWPEWQGEEPPLQHRERFGRLRSVIETGYECTALMKLVVDGVEDATIFGNFNQLCDEIIAAEHHTKESFKEFFAETRDHWRKTDENGWLSRQRFYDGSGEVFRQYVATGAEVYIATTKAERFVQALLKHHLGVVLPDDRLFGLDLGISKEQVLRGLVEDGRHAGATFHFVEDRLRTLERVCQDRALDGVNLYLATWGYVTPVDLENAEKNSRITLLKEHDFLLVPKGAGMLKSPQAQLPNL